MVICGIDPGIRGAIACIQAAEMGGIDLLSCIDLPTCVDGSNKQIDVVALGQYLEENAPDLVIIENVTPMPSIGADRRSMGATSAFRFGMACGALRAVVAAYSIPYRLVTPQVWKKAAGFPKGAPKAMSRGMAMLELASSKPFLKRVKDHNRADAVLLALYGANQGEIL